MAFDDVPAPLGCSDVKMWMEVDNANKLAYTDYGKEL